MKINCPKCMEYRASRVKRSSLLQKTIMTMLGYFPWQCGACHAIFYSKNRGLHRVA